MKTSKISAGSLARKSKRLKKKAGSCADCKRSQLNAARGRLLLTTTARATARPGEKNMSEPTLLDLSKYLNALRLQKLSLTRAVLAFQKAAVYAQVFGLLPPDYVMPGDIDGPLDLDKCLQALEELRGIANDALRRASAEGEAEASDARAPAKRRGPKRKFDPVADAEIADRWTQARGAGVCKKTFAKDRGISRKGFDALLRRVRKARTNSRVKPLK